MNQIRRERASAQLAMAKVRLLYPLVGMLYCIGAIGVFMCAIVGALYLASAICSLWH